jgi:metal transporter CNNM
MDSLVISLQIIFLLISSAICSGLNIALMSLNISELKRQVSLNNKDAERVYLLRKNSHLTLASILLTNVGVNAGIALVLNQYFNGFIAGFATTMLVVVFGEILPQAYFARNALWITSRFAIVLRFMIIITYPISKPIQVLLDKSFGNEQHILHSRRELGILIDEHLQDSASELDEDEAEIIRSTLDLSKKTVMDVMTPISKVYYLLPNDRVNAQKIDEIKTRSYSRIPVIDSNKTNCLGIVLMKDMVDEDFSEKPRYAQELRLYATKPVGARTALDTIFRTFIGARTHMMPVTKRGKIVGIVTIEDLLEEIIGHEIQDESDHLKEKS